MGSLIRERERKQPPSSSSDPRPRWDGGAGAEVLHAARSRCVMTSRFVVCDANVLWRKCLVHACRRERACALVPPAGPRRPLRSTDCGALFRSPPPLPRPPLTRVSCFPSGRLHASIWRPNHLSIGAGDKKRDAHSHGAHIVGGQTKGSGAACLATSGGKKGACGALGAARNAGWTAGLLQRSGTKGDASVGMRRCRGSRAR